MTARMLRVDKTFPDQHPSVCCHRCGSPGALIYDRAGGVFECRLPCVARRVRRGRKGRRS